MSLSKPTEQRKAKPAKKYIRWHGAAKDDRKFTYYEKYAADDKRLTKDKKGEDVEIEIDEAIILDCDLLTVTGYIEGKGYLWSNEVRDVEDVLTVRVHGDKRPLASGNWATIKEHLGREASYTKSVYLWMNGEIVNLQISGAALTSWFNDIEGRRDLHGIHYLKLKEVKEGKKGAVEYKYPVFEFGKKIAKKDLEAAIQADQLLQEYLEDYLSRQGTSTDKPAGTHEDGEEEDGETNTDNWRAHSFQGEKLGTMTIVQIRNKKATLEESGQDNGVDYDMLCRAVFDYQEATKTWKNFKDSKGKPLADYTLEEAESTLKKVMDTKPENPARFYLEAAVEELSEDDTIPF